MSSEPPSSRSPIEAVEWPDQLEARVIDDGPTPRLHGFDVEADLARHYRFGETVLLALTGEAPDEAHGRAFEIAATFALPVSVAQAPAHGAALARICFAPPSGILGYGAVTLTEMHRQTIDRFGALLAWLDAPDANPPPEVLSHNPIDRDSCARLRSALATVAVSLPALEHDLEREAAVIAAFHGCGLQTREQIAAALLWARLPAVAAEAFAATPGDFRGYPMRLPRFDYTEADDG